MSELISGKEALIALANGEEVERSPTSLKDADEKYWTSENVNNFTINDFLGKHWIFRLKPRTITINGIEVPAPFEPKDGDKYWFMDVNSRKGYEYDVCGIDHFNDEQWSFFGTWRTEEEIKQVVAALRSVFGKK